MPWTEKSTGIHDRINACRMLTDAEDQRSCWLFVLRMPLATIRLALVKISKH